jgi:sigma-E factor negative regulatory protein RseB
MLRKRNSSPLAWGFFALLVSAVAAAADADDPRQWLERMNQALVSRNYDGTFTYWQRGKVEMRRIIHRVKDGHVSERLVSLDGSGREFIRNGGELSIYLPDQKTVIVEKRPEQNPLFANFPTFDQASTEFYDIRQVKRTRIYRRDARVISVTPKDEFRYGYRLWIDEGTAMPLRTELLDPHGRVIEQLVLAEDKDLRINTNIPDSAFQPEVSTEGFVWRRSEPDMGRVLASNLRDRWNATRLPPGFRNIMQAAQSMPGSTGRVEHFVFSDGLASVSVFVETQVIATPPAATDPNASGAAKAAQPNVATTAAPGTPAAQATPASGNEVAQFGSTSAFSTVVAGRKVTAVGEVPPETVRAIANSLQSVGPPPAFNGSQAPRQTRQPAPSMSLQSSPRR